MTVRRVVLGLLVAGLTLAATPALAGPEDAAEKFDRGKALLADGDFTEALRAFGAAAKADPDNDEYRQQATLLRRIIKMRTVAESQEGTPRWLSTAEALHTYYHENGVYAEALELDRKVHAELDSPKSAVKLARTELALDMNADAAELLGSLDEDQATPEVRLLMGIALARQGQTAEARAILADYERPEKADCRLICDQARLCAQLGDTDVALKLLTHCFENCPPGQLASCRSGVKECPDFAGLCHDPGFAKVLCTESKVKGGCCPGAAAAGCSKEKAAAGCSKTCGSKEKAGCEHGAEKPAGSCPGHAKNKGDKP